MKTETPAFSGAFQRLYCDPALFEEFSLFHPVCLTRVLPFQSDDRVVDDARLLGAEMALLANPSDATRLAVIEAFGRCGLLSANDVANLKSVADASDGDFFETMGETYANAGMFICALRWYRETIMRLETQPPGTASDAADVHASVGHGLCSLGLYAEAAAWSRSCIGPAQPADTICRALINYEAASQGGCVRGIERAGSRTRYLAGADDAAQAGLLTPRLAQAMADLAPCQQTCLQWVSSQSPAPEILTDGYPFQAERDATPLTRHRFNLIVALCGQADDLLARGFGPEAKRLLHEAALLEPQAEFVQERLRSLR